MNPQGTNHQFSANSLAGTEHIYDMQMNYKDGSGTSNKYIGGILSGVSSVNYFGASFSKNTPSTINLIFEENAFAAIRIYGWEISWQPKQRIPSGFPWPMFINNFTNNGKK